MMRSHFPSPQPAARCLRGSVLAVALALLAACASVPPPNDAMQRAQMELKTARDAGAADSDPVDLNFASNKFDQAQAAMAKKKYADAANLAEESQADARLAFTKARLASLRQKIQAQSAENQRLRRQLLNKAQNVSGGQSQAPASSGSTLTLPDQVLPQPAAPAPASSSSSADGSQGGDA